MDEKGSFVKTDPCQYPEVLMKKVKFFRYLYYKQKMFYKN